MRRKFVVVHRWAGLATAVFLALAGLSGSILVFRDELEALINPHLFVVERSTQAQIDPFLLHEEVERLFPFARVDYMPFPKSGHTAMFYLMPRPDPETGRLFPLPVDQVFVDPHDGSIRGSRKWGELVGGGEFHRENIVPFIWRIHEALALPHPWGKTLMGIIALIWTIDCFVGAALTLPRRRPFASRWKTAWQVKRRARGYRRYLDLHRAFGLWLWIVLLVFAWSSVMLNLHEVIYRPVMSLVVTFQDDAVRRLPVPNYRPRLDWRDAHRTARTALEAMAAEQGLLIRKEDSLWYRPALGAYLYRTHTSLDIRSTGAASDVWVDGDSGRVLSVRFERVGSSGDVISGWLRAIHTASILGLPYRLFVAFLGIVTAMLAGTGVYLWWRKRHSPAARARSV